MQECCNQLILKQTWISALCQILIKFWDFAINPRNVNYSNFHIFARKLICDILFLSIIVEIFDAEIPINIGLNLLNGQHRGIRGENSFFLAQRPGHTCDLLRHGCGNINSTHKFIDHFTLVIVNVDEIAKCLHKCLQVNIISSCLQKNLHQHFKLVVPVLYHILYQIASRVVFFRLALN